MFNKVFAMRQECSVMAQEQVKSNKRKKLNILPGKTVGSESDYVSTDSSDSHNEIPSTRCKEDTLSDKITQKKKQNSKHKR